METMHICSYNAHPIGPWVSDRHYVSVCLDIYLSMDALIYREVVNRIGNSCVESFVVHPPYILMLVELGRKG
jgi:hypothetical protein